MTSATRRAPRASGKTRGVDSTSRVSGARPRILIVEDNADVRGLLGFILDRDGWTVEIAANGAEAISSLSESAPDVVLLDLSMPGLDGWGVLDRRAVEPVWRHVPILVMSADQHHAEAVMQRGASAFLAKPFSVDELRAALRRLLGPA
jgi:CheY-like chemotaxis protein